MATAAIFVALVPTAMQVGLATEQLRGNAAFQQASYGFAVFAILGRGRVRDARACTTVNENVAGSIWEAGDVQATIDRTDGMVTSDRRVRELGDVSESLPTRSSGVRLSAQ